ncbi:hypothetical protein E2C01_044011 [Portunus trituberculatus]|uniref:Uncharacterized protein n=1 Tax=Portunus trituberculatus TaxID=210409 RepID=A0A5B7FZ89_PORTR|nr:hypothetical protein [Portunus trituberculatus]
MHPRSLVISAAVAARRSRHTCGTCLHPRMTLSPHHNLCRHRPSLDPPVQLKPDEFGGQVAWEAYQAQLELLAQGQGWRDQEKALQLMPSLHRPVPEILAHMMANQRSTYTTVAEALRREQLKGRTCQQGVSLPQLAQAVESLVRHAYPVAPEEMVAVLSRDAFIGALEDQQVQI